jgi:predicted HTH transcriptional regulator
VVHLHLALTVVGFVSVFILLRKLIEQRGKPLSRMSDACERNGRTGGKKAADKSIVDRIRDLAFPNIPMV